MIQTVGVPIRRVSWKTSAIIEKVVLLESVMLPSSHRDQIVAVMRSYSFVTLVKAKFQVFYELIYIVYSLYFVLFIHYSLNTRYNTHWVLKSAYDV